MLSITEKSKNSEDSVYFPCYDANGNIGQMINPKAELKAAYQYDAFGRTVDLAGDYADENPWRFSTKPFESETGLYYYGYRYHDPESGRWNSKDPIEERGGLNLYGFVKNCGINFWDDLGLTWSCPDGYSVYTSPGKDPREGNVYGSAPTVQKLYGPTRVTYIKSRTMMGHFAWESLGSETGAPCGADLNLEQAYSIQNEISVELTDGVLTAGFSVAKSASWAGGPTIQGIPGKCLVGVPYVFTAKLWTSQLIGARYYWEDAIDWNSEWTNPGDAWKTKIYIQTNWLICSRPCPN